MANFLPETRLHGKNGTCIRHLGLDGFWQARLVEGTGNCFPRRYLIEVVVVVIEAIVVNSGPKNKLIFLLREGEDNFFYNLSTIISNENHILAYLATTSKCQHT